jgi:hypothetical protein
LVIILMPYAIFIDEQDILWIPSKCDFKHPLNTQVYKSF